MLKACTYCGRIPAKDFDCGKKPKRQPRYQHDSSEAGRYSRAFTEKSQQVKADSHYLCAVCLDEGKLNWQELETHHIIKLRERPDLLTDDGNLICLCRRHHRMADDGELDPDYLRRLTAGR